MVPVGVEGGDDFPVGLLFQACPGTDAGADGVPTLGTGDLRGFRKPEGALIEEFEFFLPIEERGKFPSFLAIITSDSNPSVGGKFFFEEGNLSVEGFLKSEDVRINFGDGFGDQGTSILPGVFPPISTGIADIEGGEGELGLGEAGEREEEEETHAPVKHRRD